MRKGGKRQRPGSWRAGGLTESEPLIKHFTRGEGLVRTWPALRQGALRFEVKKVPSLSRKTSKNYLLSSVLSFWPVAFTLRRKTELGGRGQVPGSYRKRGGKQHRFPLSCENCKSGGPDVCVSWPGLPVSSLSSPLPCISQGTVSPGPQR